MLSLTSFNSASEALAMIELVIQRLYVEVILISWILSLKNKARCEINCSLRCVVCVHFIALVRPVPNEERDRKKGTKI